MIGKETWRPGVKVTYLGIRSAHERVWLVEWKPIWLPRAYLTRGDLESVRGNLHVCKFLQDLPNIQIRTVTAERGLCSECICPTNVLQLNEGRKGRKEGENQKERERKKEGSKTREKAREKEQLPREREKALDSIRPETNNSFLSWIDTRISFQFAFYARSWQLGNEEDKWKPSIIKIDENTEKSPGDLRRFTVTQTSKKNHQLKLMWETLKRMKY